MVTLGGITSCQNESHMGDPETQAQLRELAAEYIERAAKIDHNSEPPDVLQFDRTTDSLEQENAWLKRRLAHIRRATRDRA
jgi:hypothetical protein